MDWTAEAIERLRALWAEGHSTAEIGRRMGISKNAVVGKAHRLNLSARPSPIRREAPGAPLRQAAAKPLRPAGLAPRTTLPQSAPEPMVASVAAAPSVQPRQQVIVRSFPRVASTKACCWPIGEPGQPGFRFCVSAAITGKPYCPEHASVAYVKARDRREDAA
jgi:GcrA cell cycle regulator